MAERRVSVRVSVSGGDFTREMEKMAAEASLASAAIRGIPNKVDVRVNTKDMTQAGHDIDRLSGRVRLFADVAAMIGPALNPIGASLVPIVTGLANQLGFAAIAGGSAILAFQGVGTALKAMDAYAVEPTTQNLQKMQEAMGKLGPAGRDFVRQLEQMKPILDQLRSSAQAGLFPGMTEALDSIITRSPQIANIISTVTSTLGDLLAEGGESLASPEWDSFFDTIENEAKPALEDMGHALGNVVSGLAALWQAFLPLSNDFGAGFLRMSADFDTWAKHLSQTKGFADFVQYVEQSGPQVASFLGAISDAFVAISRATAPLGGPVLQILTTFANVIAKIADSDMGTPIFTAVAALSAYNRLLKPALAGTIALGNTKALTLASAPIKALAADVGLLSTSWLTAGATSQREAARMSAAASRTGNAIRGAFVLGAAIAGVGLLDDAVDSLFHRNFDDSNLGRSLDALAQGRVTGELKDKLGSDLSGIGDDLRSATSKTEALGRALHSLPLGKVGDFFGGATVSNVGQLKDIDRDLAQMVESGQGKQAAAAFDQLATAANRAGFSTGELSAHLPQYKIAAQNAASVSQPLAQTIKGVGVAAGLTAGEVNSLVTSMHNERQAALGAFDAETQWRQALVAAQKQAAKSSAGIQGNSVAAIANRQAISGLAAAWNNQSDAVKNNKKRFEEARAAFIQTAHDMGVPMAAARALAKSLLEIPKRTVVSIEAGTDQALSAIQRIKAEMRGVPRSISTDFYVNQVNRFNKGPVTGPGARSADGSTVPKGGPYTDRFPYLLAPGEEVITNRHGEADHFRAMRSAGLIPGMADGGKVPRLTVSELSSARHSFDLTPSMTVAQANKEIAQFVAAIHKAGGHFAADMAYAGNRSMTSLDGLTRRVDTTATRIGRLSTALGDVRSAQSSAQSSAFTAFNHDPFGGSLSDFVTQTSADRNDAKSMQAAINKAKGKGLDGLLAANLEGSGNLALAQQFAGSSKAEIRHLEQLYAAQQHAATQVGNQAAASLGPEIKALSAHMKRQSQVLNKLEKTIEHLPKDVQNGAAQGAQGNKARAAAGRRNG